MNELMANELHDMKHGKSYSFSLFLFRFTSIFDLYRKQKYFTEIMMEIVIIFMVAAVVVVDGVGKEKVESAKKTPAIINHFHIIELPS